MSTQTSNNKEDQEIDLAQISKKISDFFQGINRFLFKCIQFFVKNWIIVSILLMVGFSTGIYLDTVKKTYKHQIIVTPNFGSTDYLYSKIDLIASKIKENDTVFLKEIIGIKHPKEISKIEVKPIVDVYNFIGNKPENFELIKLLAEDGDIEQVIEENLTSKNYAFHTISVRTTKVINEKEIIQPILNFLNNSDYYNKVQKEAINNVVIKMIQNDTIISQINGFLNEFSNTISNSQKSDKLVYYNENTQLNDVIKTKDALINEQGTHRLNLVGLDKIIKDNSTIINIENTEKLNGKLKFVLPFLLIFGFILIQFFNRFYKKQKAVSLLLK
jgi:hypothetical protein